jgi:hypothetical protein
MSLNSISNAPDGPATGRDILEDGYWLGMWHNVALAALKEASQRQGCLYVGYRAFESRGMA